MNNNMDIEKLAYNHGANIYENGEVRFYTLNAFNKFAEAYHQAKCNEEIQTLRAKVSANEQDAERYRYLKENYVMANFNIYDHEDFSNGQTGLIIEVPNGIDINRDLDLVVDQALANYDKLSEVKHDTK